MKVSVIIKALNEEANIERSIQSALHAVSKIPGGGEVILADSLSTDQTVALAQQHPVVIAQLKNPRDRSCGIGAQLGFNVAQGEYLYILDADMEFHDGFLTSCVQHLDDNPQCAGVGGLITEMETSNREFLERYKRKANTLVKAGKVSFLGMGGLYRRCAIQQVGYFTNKTLNSYEEFELGARLNNQGWELTRLNIPGVMHYGYQIGEYALLLKRLKTGYIYGLGELLRSVWRKPYFVFTLRNLRQIRIYAAYFAWFAVAVLGLLFSVFSALPVWLPLFWLLLPVVALAVKKRGLSAAVYTVVSGVFNGWGMLAGFVKSKPSDPMAEFEFQVVS
ncbi:glycosyltransferase [Halioxenophilus aromaticivorans]|uniref:Glycosyltransferase n=1 Tax=Halioxenophilus aromaticivorans TaxID=1306992 RepID=A0AAV3U1X0_9ALTE